MTNETHVAELISDMRNLANRIIECQGENSDGENIIDLYDLSDTTFKAENIILILDQLEAAEARIAELVAMREATEFEIKDLRNKLENPVPLPRAAYFKNSAENLPFFRALQVIEAIHGAGFQTVTYED